MRCTKENLRSYIERKIVANVQNSVFGILSELWQSFISYFRFKDAANVDLSFECHVGAYILSTLILRNFRVFRKFWGISVCEWESCFFSLECIFTNCHNNTMQGLFLRIGAKLPGLQLLKEIIYGKLTGGRE